jgi:hypothetical protein
MLQQVKQLKEKKEEEEEFHNWNYVIVKSWLYN